MDNFKNQFNTKYLPIIKAKVDVIKDQVGVKKNETS